MKHRTWPTAVTNLKKNFPLLISTIAALCLFFSPSLISFALCFTIFVAVLVMILQNRVTLSDRYSRPSPLTVTLVALLMTCIGYWKFKTLWTPSSKVAALAGTLHLSTSSMLLIVGAVGCVMGFYAIYVSAGWIVIWIKSLLKKYLPEQRKQAIISNLKNNWYFSLSAVAFFCLYATQKLESIVGLLFVFVFTLIISTQVPHIWKLSCKSNICTCVISILTTIGICIVAQGVFRSYWGPSIKLFYVSILLAINAVFFVYSCVLVLWNELIKIISENGVFANVSVAEWIVYSILIIASLVYVVYAFAQTEAFYGTKYFYDIIYTSDSPDLVKGNTYLKLTHPENDLRQPLFAVFAAPFVGTPYLLGKLFRAPASVQAMLLNSVQVLMLFTANFILTKMMKLTPVKRICFMLLTSFTYTQLLFILMMEQYIVAYFWLVLCIFLITERPRPNPIVLCGAGGTLLTSLVLLPFMSEKNPIKDRKEWFADIEKYALGFVIAILVFSRFDVIYNLHTRIITLGGFTGKTVTFTEKIYQYAAFVCTCFIAPEAGVDMTAFDHISWQLNPITSINFIGLAIMLLVIISAVLNRNKKSSLLAISWVAFSLVMLLGLGWGTIENGLILYALYFGWAFLVMLFQLVERIENARKVKFLVPIFSIGCTIVLAVVNIPAIMEMINFAITYYPA